MRRRQVWLRSGAAFAALAAIPTAAAAMVPDRPATSPTSAIGSSPTSTQPTTDPTRTAPDRASRSLVGERPALLKGLVAQGGAIEEAPSRAAPVVKSHRFVTTALNVWSGPGESFDYLRELPAGAKVAITGEQVGAWAQVVIHGQSRWVRAAYLSTTDPGEITTTGGVTEAPCPLGTAVESGLTPDAVRVYRSVCAQFPEVTTYGGLRGDGEHSEGRAVDIMVPSSAVGDAIAEWVRANATQLGASEVLWAQHIWTVERSSEGWRLFEDRGSITANHYDHVHVTVYGDSGG